MRSYLLRRILVSIPTLLLMVMLTFLLTQLGDANTAEQFMQSMEDKNYPEKIKKEACTAMLKKLELDKPVFYFSFSSMSSPSKKILFYNESEKKAFERLCFNYGNPTKAETYYKKIPDAEAMDLSVLSALRREYNETKIYEVLAPGENDDDVLFIKKAELKYAFDKLVKTQTHYKSYIPVIHFWGTENRFHHWFAAFISGDWGRSFRTQNKVTEEIKNALPNTLLINFIAIFFLLIIAIPLGVWMAYRYHFFARCVRAVLFASYALPVFWVAGLLLIFFAGGNYFSWFPLSGLSSDLYDATTAEKWADTAWHLALPVFCILYPALSFVSRQMQAAINRELQQPYIQTSYAKGQDKKRTIWVHAFRNTLIPVITIVTLLLPEIVNGSVVIESIFSIPGIGMKSFQAVMMRDYPFILFMVMLTGVITVAAGILADIFYALANPKIRYT